MQLLVTKFKQVGSVVLQFQLKPVQMGQALLEPTVSPTNVPPQTLMELVPVVEIWLRRFNQTAPVD